MTDNTSLYSAPASFDSQASSTTSSNYTSFNYSNLTNSNAGTPRSVTLPTGVLQSGQMSTTSLASDCFSKQQFCGNLQAFLVGYVNEIYSDFSVYD